MKKIRIGCGAGYAGDRIEPAIELVKGGKLDYIVFECLAERTIAIAQQDKAKNPDKGYNHLLEDRMRAILPIAKEMGVKIISNMGAANPISAINKTAEIARELGLSGLRLAAVTGDGITEGIGEFYDNEVLELGCKLAELSDKIVSANAYTGAEGILAALEGSADIILTGRVSDPSLVIAPLIHEFGWSNEPDKIGQAVLAGHLLECAGQVTGGYYADPGFKEVPNLAALGFPLIEMGEDGSFIITKVEGSGGMVTTQTCKEQLLYEIHDPQSYLTPDAIADFSKVRFTELEPDVVQATGATSFKKPDNLKVSIGYKDCFIGEGEIHYGGRNALARAKLAGEVVAKRLEIINAEVEELRIDYIGSNSLYMDKISNTLKHHGSPEIRLRISGRTKDAKNAAKIANEVEALYTNGPAGGGGATKAVFEIISICSIFIPREAVKTIVTYTEV